MGDILDRTLCRIGCEDLPERLRELPNSDLNSLFLELYNMQADRADAGSVLKSHSRSRFTSRATLIL